MLAQSDPIKRRTLYLTATGVLTSVDEIGGNSFRYREWSIVKRSQSVDDSIIKPIHCLITFFFYIYAEVVFMASVLDIKMKFNINNFTKLE